MPPGQSGICQCKGPIAAAHLPSIKRASTLARVQFKAASRCGGRRSSPRGRNRLHLCLGVALHTCGGEAARRGWLRLVLQIPHVLGLDHSDAAVLILRALQRDNAGAPPSSTASTGCDAW